MDIEVISFFYNIWLVYFQLFRVLSGILQLAYMAGQVETAVGRGIKTNAYLSIYFKRIFFNIFCRVISIRVSILVIG